MTGASKTESVLHWYDLTCPFCYVARSRTELFARAGVDVVALPFQAHPGIPPGGQAAGPRQGAMYAMIDDEARKAGMILRWPPRIPNSRRALAAAEWVRRHRSDVFADVQHGLFAAHFELGEDIDDPDVVERVVVRAGVEWNAVDAAFGDGSAYSAVTQSEQRAARVGVDGTPAWLSGDHLIVGLQPEGEFERIANSLKR